MFLGIHLTGERTPHDDATIQGAFVGLVPGTDRAALAYSVIEGVDFGLADGLAGGETGAALGAARLGALACGGEEATVCSRPPVSRTFEPSPAGRRLLVDRLGRFRALHRAVAPIFRGA